jgi:GNAT superfamily N-acetyltransferase
MSIVVATADTPKDIESALRLRYEVFTVEASDTRYANHVTRTYSDPTDTQRAKIVIARDGGTTVGTLRLTFRADGPFIADALYRFPLILCEPVTHPGANLTAIALVDRVVVHRSCRGRGILPRMLEHAVELARARGCTYMVMAVAAASARMQSILDVRGWFSYHVSDPANGWTGRHFYQRIGR